MTPLLLGIFLFTFLEYVHHRHAGHLKWFGLKLYKPHMQHHGDPQEGGVKLIQKFRQRLSLILFLNLLLCLPILTLNYFLFHSIISGCISLIGINIGYFYSEWFHHRMHHKTPVTKIGIYLWKHHYVHHFSNTKVNFGFTSPLWDFVFNTYQPAPKTLKIPYKQAPRGIDSNPEFQIS